MRGEEARTKLQKRLHSEIPPRARRRVAVTRTRQRLPEIPPRARRRGLFVYGHIIPEGNTSACAEKRCAAPDARCLHRKYLRVRGEEWVISSSSRSIPEIPPRARRRACAWGSIHTYKGNTSACAEKSLRGLIIRAAMRKYLRVRGEERLISAC